MYKHEKYNSLIFFDKCCLMSPDKVFSLFSLESSFFFCFYPILVYTFLAFLHTHIWHVLNVHQIKKSISSGNQNKQIDKFIVLNKFIKYTKCSVREK